nr:hypothetical protein [Azospirillum argentinense]
MPFTICWGAGSPRPRAPIRRREGAEKRAFLAGRRLRPFDDLQDQRGGHEEQPVVVAQHQIAGMNLDAGDGDRPVELRQLQPVLAGARRDARRPDGEAARLDAGAVAHRAVDDDAGQTGGDRRRGQDAAEARRLGHPAGVDDEDVAAPGQGDLVDAAALRPVAGGDGESRRARRRNLPRRDGGTRHAPSPLQRRQAPPGNRAVVAQPVEDVGDLGGQVGQGEIALDDRGVGPVDGDAADDGGVEQAEQPVGIGGQLLGDFRIGHRSPQLGLMPAVWITCFHCA